MTKTSGTKIFKMAALAILLLLLLHEIDGNIFQEHRKKREENRRRRKMESSKRREPFAPKLPQTEEAKEWRQNRIQSSLNRLDAYLKEAGMTKHPISRNQSIETTFMSSNQMRTSFVDSEAANTSSFLEVEEKFAGAALGAAANMLFSRTTMCVMCSYILEMADRQVKASPRWANGGGGFFPGQVDFSPGENQGFFRTYPGGYLETEERVSTGAPIGSGKPEAPVLRRGGRQDFTAAKSYHSSSSFGASEPAAHMLPANFRLQEASVMTGGPPHIDPNPNPHVNYDRANSMYGMGTDNGLNPKPLGGKKERVGRFTPRDYDRVDSQSEKSMEYQQMFNDVMDALDEICFKDLPASYSQYCNLPYMNGEAVVERYLHDYEDWEICQKIFSCISGFYDGL